MQNSRFGDAVRLFCFIPALRYSKPAFPIPKSQASDSSLPLCVGTDILHPPHYPRTDANPPHYAGLETPARLHYSQNNANPFLCVHTGILQPHCYPHTDTNPPHCVGMNIPRLAHYPHTDTNPPHCVGTDILHPLHYPHTDAKPHSTKHAGCTDETFHPHIPHICPSRRFQVNKSTT